MTRNRLEDLGRVMVMLENLLDHPLFENQYWHRPKDANEWFGKQSEEKKDDVIHEIAYALEGFDFKIHDILSICRGTDDLEEVTK